MTEKTCDIILKSLNVALRAATDDENEEQMSTIEAAIKEVSDYEEKTYSNEDHEADYDDAMSPYYHGGCQSMEDIYEAQQDIHDLHDIFDGRY